MNKRDRMYQAIEKHGQKLIEFFGLENQDAIKLCKKLFTLENKGNKLCEDYCNGYIDLEDFEIEKEKIIAEVAKILLLDKLYFNSDPRGYFLKIKDEYSKEFYYHDLGGYGIIAPDFRE